MLLPACVYLERTIRTQFLEYGFGEDMVLLLKYVFICLNFDTKISKINTCQGIWYRIIYVISIISKINVLLYKTYLIAFAKVWISFYDFSSHLCWERIKIEPPKQYISCIYRCKCDRISISMHGFFRILPSLLTHLWDICCFHGFQWNVWWTFHQSPYFLKYIVVCIKQILETIKWCH